MGTNPLDAYRGIVVAPDVECLKYTPCKTVQQFIDGFIPIKETETVATK